MKPSLLSIAMIGAVPFAYAQNPTDTRQPSGLGEGAEMQDTGAAAAGIGEPAEAEVVEEADDTDILPAEKTITEQIADSDGFSMLETALAAAGLTETLDGGGPYTLFAPTDTAFGKLDAGRYEELLQPENKEQLAALLKTHVVSERVPSEDLTTGEIETMGDRAINVVVSEGTITVGGATVTMADIVTNNGIIHAIDEVLVEEEPARREPAPVTPPEDR